MYPNITSCYLCNIQYFFLSNTKIDEADRESENVGSA